MFSISSPEPFPPAEPGLTGVIARPAYYGRLLADASGMQAAILGDDRMHWALPDGRIVESREATRPQSRGWGFLRGNDRFYPWAFLPYPHPRILILLEDGTTVRLPLPFPAEFGLWAFPDVTGEHIGFLWERGDGFLLLVWRPTHPPTPPRMTAAAPLRPRWSPSPSGGPPLPLPLLPSVSWRPLSGGLVLEDDRSLVLARAGSVHVGPSLGVREPMFLSPMAGWLFWLDAHETPHLLHPDRNRVDAWDPPAPPGHYPLPFGLQPQVLWVPPVTHVGRRRAALTLYLDRWTPRGVLRQTLHIPPGHRVWEMARVLGGTAPRNRHEHILIGPTWVLVHPSGFLEGVHRFPLPYLLRDLGPADGQEPRPLRTRPWRPLPPKDRAGPVARMDASRSFPHRTASAVSGGRG